LAETLKTTRIPQVVDLTGGRPAVVTTRPVRAPSHTISALGRIGGDQLPMPREVSLIYYGILCLDEFPECTRCVLEVLRQPLEESLI
jgi:magnesium chelatase family protein